VKQGQQLALRGNISSMIRCSSGGHNSLMFIPSLRTGGPAQGVTDASGCWILMEPSSANPAPHLFAPSPH
jgi:hypothetical protein